MTAVTEFFCNFCNPSAQRRDPGDEVSTGYQRVEFGSRLPRGWQETFFDGVPGAHICPDCLRAGKQPEAPRPLVSKIAQSGWPAHLSPFDE